MVKNRKIYIVVVPICFSLGWQKRLIKRDNMTQSPYETIDSVVQKMVEAFNRDVRLLHGKHEDAVSDESITYQDFAGSLAQYYEMRGEFSNALKTYFKAKYRRAPEGSEIAERGKDDFVDEILPMYFPIKPNEMSEFSEKKFKTDLAFRQKAIDVVKSLRKAKAMNIVHYFGNVKNSAIDDLCNDAEHDYLTGFLNKKPLHERLNDETARIDRESGLENAYGRHCIIYIDLDNFKKINDVLGHTAGDEALKDVAGIIRYATRVYDTKGRVGGEEIVIYMPDTTIDEARKKADEIRKTIMRLTKYIIYEDGKELRLTASMGVATLRENHASINDMIKDAEDAMYLIKAGQKNGVEVFLPSKKQEYLQARQNYKGREK